MVFIINSWCERSLGRRNANMSAILVCSQPPIKWWRRDPKFDGCPFNLWVRRYFVEETADGRTILRSRRGQLDIATCHPIYELAQSLEHG
jgi:hypothetical protein